jgi:hypothetical protein
MLIREAHQTEKLRLQKEEESNERGGRRSKNVPGLLATHQGKRFVRFDDAAPREASARVIVPGFPGEWPTWLAFGPPSRKEPLWTSYDVEGCQTEVHSTTTGARQDSTQQRPTSGSQTPYPFDAPVCCLIAVDFAQAYYDTPPGRKKIEKVHEELLKLSAIRHPNVSAILASKVRSF